MLTVAPLGYEGLIRMSLRLSLAAAAALLGVVFLAAPACAVMQVIHLPDPNAPAQDGPPDGMFDKSVPDHWQGKTTDTNQQGLGSFHFTASGAGGGYSSTRSPSAYDTAKQPGSEFYQPLPGYDPVFGH